MSLESVLILCATLLGGCLGASDLDIDFESGFGHVWKSYPQVGKGAWLIERYDPILGIPLPILTSGWHYLRGQHLDCYNGEVSPTFEATATVNPGDNLVYNYFAWAPKQGQTGIQLSYGVEGSELNSFDVLSAPEQTNWINVILPMPVNETSQVHFVFTYGGFNHVFDKVAINNLRLISPSTGKSSPLEMSL